MQSGDEAVAHAARRSSDQAGGGDKSSAAYYVLIEEMDRNIGKVIDAVKASSTAEDTIIMYCSDRVEMAGKKGLWWKGSFYEGSVGVLHICSRPGIWPSGSVASENVSLIDIGPTLLELAGGPKLPEATGSYRKKFPVAA
jgi:arylsulfatase